MVTCFLLIVFLGSPLLQPILNQLPKLTTPESTRLRGQGSSEAVFLRLGVEFGCCVGCNSARKVEESSWRSFNLWDPQPITDIIHTTAISKDLDKISAQADLHRHLLFFSCCRLNQDLHWQHTKQVFALNWNKTALLYICFRSFEQNPLQGTSSKYFGLQHALHLYCFYISFYILPALLWLHSFTVVEVMTFTFMQHAELNCFNMACCKSSFYCYCLST